MKRIIMLAMVLVMLVSIGGCYWGWWDGRGGGHDEGRRGGRHDRGHYEERR